MSITLNGSSDSAFSDGININSGKFTVAAASGNTVVGGTFVVSTTASPTSGGAGTAGQIAWDASYIYICTATNTWKRAALTGGY